MKYDVYEVAPPTITGTVVLGIVFAALVAVVLTGLVGLIRDVLARPAVEKYQPRHAAPTVSRLARYQAGQITRDEFVRTEPIPVVHVDRWASAA